MPLAPAILVLALSLPNSAAATDHTNPPAPATAPLAVTVHRDTATVAEGDRVTYRIEVDNRSGTDYPAASLTQLMPSGMRALAIDENGVAANGGVEWTAHLAPHSVLQRTLTVEVGSKQQVEHAQVVHVVQPSRAAKPDGGQFTTTACVRPEAGAALTCGSDLAAWKSPDHGHGLLWGGTAAALLSACAGFLAWRRWGRKRTGPAVKTGD
ncbi:hypothetical protein GCM10009760_32010 [Kitasatospora kazusensis]|uniref:DUF11 domain-containing protein n=1 Tax=Kitasatospora kazusensis TaxID=407974 RepID=A0ABP5LD05_9ACTN